MSTRQQQNTPQLTTIVKLAVPPKVASHEIPSICQTEYSLQKTVGKSVTDSNFERSNISLKENKRDGVDSNSNGFDYCVRENEEKILWFSADWNRQLTTSNQQQEEHFSKRSFLKCAKAQYWKIKNLFSQYTRIWDLQKNVSLTVQSIFLASVF